MKKKAKSKPSSASARRNQDGIVASDSASEERVVLRPFLGMKPGLYLSILYSGALLLILFFALVFPGIRAFGAQVSIRSNPQGATVRIDGVRVGATPIVAFVAAGSHDITISKPYFSDYTEKSTVPGRLFGTLFAPARVRMNVSLALASGDDLRKNAAAKYASWALIGEAHSQYQFPPVLTEAVHDLYAGKESSPAVPGKAKDLLAAALTQAQSPSLLRDFVNAQALDDSAAQVTGPLQLASMFQKIIQLEKNSPGFPLWLSVVLPSDASARLVQSDWYRTYLSRYRDETRLTEAQTRRTALAGPARVDVDGIPFVGIPGGTFVMGREDANQTSTDPLLVSAKISVRSFYVMETEASRAMFARFLTANPQWLPSSRAELAGRGLVTSDYLAGWSGNGAVPPGTAALPVTDVSYDAAVAFAHWLTTRLPGSLSGFEVRLPTEAEWEYAARLNDTTPQEGVFQDTYPAAGQAPQPIGTGNAGTYGLRDMLGNVWEWTASWYRPAAPALALRSAQGDSPAEGIAISDPAAALLPAAHRTVKGGSFANRSDVLSAATRGSLPPDWCTPYLGFRLVIVRK
ncbi:MAG TPA: SUMF1/EgtB/PvdO family nonheme iron enzyme [Spirochaetia bacterium]|nr:SUMF1/EgtB/PvdO family nonheme iron enzyme [Spirochaetia bacterium]